MKTKNEILKMSLNELRKEKDGLLSGKNAKDLFNFRCSDCSNCSNCSDCSDCSGCLKCSWCSECSDCSDCLGCLECLECSGCSDCSDCYLCVGAKNLKYAICNVELTKEEYEKKIKEIIKE